MYWPLWGAALSAIAPTKKPAFRKKPLIVHKANYCQAGKITYHYPAVTKFIWENSLNKYTFIPPTPDVQKKKSWLKHPCTNYSVSIFQGLVFTHFISKKEQWAIIYYVYCDHTSTISKLCSILTKWFRTSANNKVQCWNCIPKFQTFIAQTNLPTGQKYLL